MLARQLEQLIQWTQTTIGPAHTSYIHLPNTVSIIDGTEIFIERPSNLATQINRHGLITRATALPSILYALIPSQVYSHVSVPRVFGKCQ